MKKRPPRPEPRGLQVFSWADRPSGDSLKIVVSPVRVRVSPSQEIPCTSDTYRRATGPRNERLRAAWAWSVFVSRPLRPFRMGRAVMAGSELRALPFRCHCHVHGPSLAFRVPERRPEPQVFSAAGPVAIPAHPSLSEVSGGHRGERTAVTRPAPRKRAQPALFVEEQRSPPAGVASSKCGPVKGTA